jgi:hypothetical protein
MTTKKAQTLLDAALQKYPERKPYITRLRKQIAKDQAIKLREAEHISPDIHAAINALKQPISKSI